MRYESRTGLDREQIEELAARIGQILASVATGRGRPTALGLYRSVLVALVLLRQNLSQTLVADWFGVSQSTVLRTYRRLLPLLEQVTCLHRPPLPEVLRGRVVLVDGTLVPIGNRETDRAVHERNYHGRTHDRTHDRVAFTAAGFDTLLADTPTIADLGYQGTTALRPRRKRPGRTQTRANDIWNSAISTLRVAVERAIAHWKNWKILATGYRGRLTELPNIIRIVTTLEYYRLGW